MHPKVLVLIESENKLDEDVVVGLFFSSHLAECICPNCQIYLFKFGCCGWFVFLFSFSRVYLSKLSDIFV